MVSCCAYCDKEYGVGGAFVGVPAVLGAGGVEKIVELELTEDEKQAFDDSAAHIKDLVVNVKKFL